jgi:hypothetical protein
VGAALGGPAGAIAAPAVKKLIEIGRDKMMEWASQGCLDKEIQAIEKETAVLETARIIATRVVSDIGDRFAQIPILQDLSESMWQELRMTSEVCLIAQDMQKDIYALLCLSDVQRYAAVQMPKMRSLYEILPPDHPESGSEFKRIVGLLLFHASRSRGKTLNLNEGPHGLDAVEMKGKAVTIGYEFRFCPSPVGLQDRQGCEEWLGRMVSKISGLDLRPAPQWREALLEIYVPTIPKRILMVQPEWWTTIRDAFQHGEPTHSDIYAASALLIFSGMLYIIGLDQPDYALLRERFSYTDERIEELQKDSESARAIFDQIADLTRSRNDAALCIAHCIRDLAYGDESRADDLKRMVQSEDPEYREIFERCYWRATVEEEKGL